VKRRVLIAGFGYVGRALAADLRPHEVTALSRSGAGAPGVTAAAGDLSSPLAIGSFDWVVYAASPDARTEDAYARVYVRGVRHALALASERFLLVSSTGVYGESEGRWVDEDTPPEPKSATGRMLLEGENLVRAAAVSSIVLRLGGIYGPTRTRLIDRVRSGEATLSGTPRYSNRIHRDDCAGAMAHLLALDAPDDVYVGVDDEPADLDDVQRFIARELGLPEPRTGSEAATESNKRCSNARLKATGYRFRYPTFREGYRSLIEESRRER
jgi:nucleoside-diphosphate-sugar epimerase